MKKTTTKGGRHMEEAGKKEGRKNGTDETGESQEEKSPEVKRQEGKDKRGGGVNRHPQAI